MPKPCLAFDAFTLAWFFDVVVPEYRLRDANAVAADGSGVSWRVTVTVENAGSGRMPVQVAAVAAERFDDDGEPRPEYRESRVEITLGPSEQAVVEIPCEFQPDRVVVDPDALVLQLNRDSATVEF